MNMVSFGQKEFQHSKLLKIDNLEKVITINKLKSDKFLLFNELNELVHSLKMVDIKTLNKFFKKFNQDRAFTRSEMPYSMGIKYNIMTAQNQLAFLIHSDLVASKTSFNDTYNKVTESLADERNKVKLNIPQSSPEKTCIDIDNYISVISKFEKDFQRTFDNSAQNDKKDFQGFF